MRPRRYYTNKEIDLVRLYAAEGVTIRQTAKAISREAGSVASTAKRYGIQFHGKQYKRRGQSRYTPEERKAISREMWRRWERRQELKDAAD